MSRICKRFSQFGGFQLFVEYCRMGLLGTCCKLGLSVLIRRMKRMEAYRKLLHEVESKLRKEYTPVLLQKEKDYCNERTKRDEPRRIWFCWLQGLENAPELVKHSSFHKLTYRINQDAKKKGTFYDVVVHH